MLCIIAPDVLLPQSAKQPITGTGGSGLGVFDDAMLAFMDKWHLPGGQLAIAKDGRLVLNRAYGYADTERQEAATPNHLFRIGSISKTLTTIAILALVRAGRLQLEDKAFRILSDLRPPKRATVDPRIYDITVQHLLQHQGGWASSDALELPWSRMAAATLGESDPPSCETVIRYVLSIPLDFAPGTKSNYSNFGFCVLGRIIERIATASNGKRTSYEAFVQSTVLKPAGITRMRIGGTRLSERTSGEALYYSAPGPSTQTISLSGGRLRSFCLWRVLFASLGCGRRLDRIRRGPRSLCDGHRRPTRPSATQTRNVPQDVVHTRAIERRGQGSDNREKQRPMLDRCIQKRRS
jgi:CubicO group peptidase (beta-lactamase class C family)